MSLKILVGDTLCSVKNTNATTIVCIISTVEELKGNITVHVAGMGYAAFECDSRLNIKPPGIVHVEPQTLNNGGKYYYTCRTP